MAVPVSVEPFTEPESTRGFSPAWVDRLLAAPFTRALIGAVLVLVVWADAAREGFWGLPSPFEASEGLGGYALALAAGGAVGALCRRRHRPAPSDTSPRLPVFLRFDHRRVIVVGGGGVAASKLPALLAAARRLGVTENRLHDWKKAVAKKGADAFPGSGHLTPIEEENRKLRADVKRLEMERDILKKATAFFATQMK